MMNSFAMPAPGAPVPPPPPPVPPAAPAAPAAASVPHPSNNTNNNTPTATAPSKQHKRKRLTPQHVKVVPSIWERQNAVPSHPSYKNIVYEEQTEAANRQCADLFATAVRQQLDNNFKAPKPKKLPPTASVQDMVATQQTNQIHAMLTEHRNDVVQELVQLMDVAEHEALLKIQQRKESRYYYKKFKQSDSSKHKTVDQDLGCNETITVFPDAASTTTNDADYSKKEEQQVVLAVQETALIQETARRIRLQAQELAKKRV